MDPMTIGATALGGLGGLFSFFGQKSANETNLQIMRENNAFNAEQAKNAMLFQQEMSNTAYQRATADMKAAGINPMMAYMQGGASTPSGSAASATNATMQSTDPSEGIRAGLSSALALASTKKDLEQKDGQIALQKAQEGAAKAAEKLNENSAWKTAVETLGKDFENDITAANMDGALQEAKNRKRQADYDAKALNYDNTTRRVREGLGLVNDAVGIVKPKIQIGGSKEPRDASGRTRAEVERDNYKKRYDALMKGE